jgi:hypothetical protein
VASLPVSQNSLPPLMLTSLITTPNPNLSSGTSGLATSYRKSFLPIPIYALNRMKYYTRQSTSYHDHLPASYCRRFCTYVSTLPGTTPSPAPAGAPSPAKRGRGKQAAGRRKTSPLGNDGKCDEETDHET